MYTKTYCVLLLSFASVRVRFASDEASDRQVRFRMTNQAEVLHSVIKVPRRESS
jgi:hypothetical protein